MTIRFPFDNTYARLPDRFHARVAPTAGAAPQLLRLNTPLAVELGLDTEALMSPDGVAVLSGQAVPEGAEPIALAYAGHQFGQFVPQLGDGRAILLGEVVDVAGRRRDIQLKGSGRTPFSRRGDGRAALGPVLREYIVSEAMAALGIPTTRALAAALTGDMVVRDTLLPGAILTRVAASHVRVGTFEFFAARGDAEGVRLLADHVIARHYPEAANAPNPYRALLDGVIVRQAELIARWMLVGFIHGVMNTDNTSIAGETIDYGPCAFMDAYDPATVFSSIDQNGRYAYGNQPRIAQWNLARLAETLIHLFADDKDAALAEAQAAIDAFAPRYEDELVSGLRRKLGLGTRGEGDALLARSFLAILAENRVDFTLAFRRLGDAAAGPAGDAAMQALFAAGGVADGPDAYDRWAAEWRARVASEGGDPAARRAAMMAENPAYIPRNHLVEEAIAAALSDGDLGPFNTLVEVLSRPFEERPDLAPFAEPPAPSDEVYRTFCGT